MSSLKRTITPPVLGASQRKGIAMVLPLCKKFTCTQGNEPTGNLGSEDGVGRDHARVSISGLPLTGTYMLRTQIH